ncbi:helix-turn-helix domain-containing protein [Zhenhengia yiwuensis]|uniref:Helix-turn-helix transcriptional regulator n=1 Tax=Zhenhengia yiwuensis TaxID=2763666 RepID=A0A926EI00_9FIRM|nr:helix-turn-helix transcriptional regulator [Zhenhengia yiwuensis]MBC8579991.1 helix-turn-helix transcriptional regulator [Zhenhengia yiwuensis]
MNKNEVWIEAGSKLRNIRKKKGLSVFQVRDELGVPLSYIIKLERGKVMPSEAIIVSLAMLYEIDRKQIYDMYQLIESNRAEEIASLSPYLRQIANDRSISKLATQEYFDEVLDELKEIAEKYRI